MVEALEAGAHAVLAASIFHNQERTIREVKEVLARNGQEVRMLIPSIDIQGGEVVQLIGERKEPSLPVLLVILPASSADWALLL